AQLYAKEGEKVNVAELNDEGAEAVVKGIKDNGGEAKDVKVNVAKVEEINNMIDFAVDTYGTLDILINNAGVMDGMEPVGNIDDEKWDIVFDINTKAVMSAMRKAMPIYLEKGKDVIVNTVSTG